MLSLGQTLVNKLFHLRLSCLCIFLLNQVLLNIDVGCWRNSGYCSKFTRQNPFISLHQPRLVFSEAIICSVPEYFWLDQGGRSVMSWILLGNITSGGCYCLFITCYRPAIGMLSLFLGLRGLSRVRLCGKPFNSVVWRHKIGFLSIGKFLLWLFVAAKNIEPWQTILSLHDAWNDGWKWLKWPKRWKHQTIPSLLAVGGYFAGQCFWLIAQSQIENSIGCSGLAEEDYFIIPMIPALWQALVFWWNLIPVVMFHLTVSLIDLNQTRKSDGWNAGSPHCPWAVSIWANNILLSNFHTRNLSWSRKV